MLILCDCWWMISIFGWKKAINVAIILTDTNIGWTRRLMWVIIQHWSLVGVWWWWLSISSLGVRWWWTSILVDSWHLTWEKIYKEWHYYNMCLHMTSSTPHTFYLSNDITRSLAFYIFLLPLILQSHPSQIIRVKSSQHCRSSRIL